MKDCIVFVDLERHFYDKHAIYYLSAYLKQEGIQVNYVNEVNFEKVVKRLKELKPSLLGYNIFTSNLDKIIKFDKHQKTLLNIRSIAGGPSIIYNPGQLSGTTIDAICVGEGEKALVQFFRSGFTFAKNIIVHSNSTSLEYDTLIDNLDSLPFPDRKLVYDEIPYFKHMKYRMFLSGKGCPYACTYCHNHAFNERFKGKGKIIRKKSVGYFIEEISRVVKEYGAEIIVMQDDTFILEKEWLFNFCKAYKKEINLPFTCFIRANLVDEDIARCLKDAKCVTVCWSIESGNEYFSNKILKRNISNKQLVFTADLFNKFGIRQRVSSMVGLPGEKYRNMLETLELNIRCKPFYAHASTLVPFPGLEITRYSLENGYLSEDYIYKLPNTTRSISLFNFTGKEKSRIIKLVYLFPFFVRYRILYQNNFLYRFCFLFPKGILKYIFCFNDMIKMLRCYPFSPTINDCLNIFKRYFSTQIEKKVNICFRKKMMENTC